MILVILCSPKAHGVSDGLAEAFLRGAATSGAKTQCLPLRDYEIIPCTGCGACAKPPHHCILAPKDEAEGIFSLFLRSEAAIFFSPIYFYHIPAHFKAFIDRGQRFWAAGPNGLKKRYAAAVFACGRPRGEKLFSGARLTLKYFCQAMGGNLAQGYGYRGLDCRQDLEAKPEILLEQFKFGRDLGQKLAAIQC